jgi:hypothetical protein
VLASSSKRLPSWLFSLSWPYLLLLLHLVYMFYTLPFHPRCCCSTVLARRFPLTFMVFVRAVNSRFLARKIAPVYFVLNVYRGVAGSKMSFAALKNHDSQPFTGHASNCSLSPPNRHFYRFYLHQCTLLHVSYTYSVFMAVAEYQQGQQGGGPWDGEDAGRKRRRCQGEPPRRQARGQQQGHEWHRRELRRHQEHGQPELRRER